MGSVGGEFLGELAWSTWSIVSREYGRAEKGEAEQVSLKLGGSGLSERESTGESPLRVHTEEKSKF